MDHGGDEARAIGYNVDHFIPKVFCVNPLDRLADIGAYHFVALVHLFSLLSLDAYIIA